MGAKSTWRNSPARRSDRACRRARCHFPQMPVGWASSTGRPAAYGVLRVRGVASVGGPGGELARPLADLPRRQRGPGSLPRVGQGSRAAAPPAGRDQCGRRRTGLSGLARRMPDSEGPGVCVFPSGGPPARRVGQRLEPLAARTAPSRSSIRRSTGRRGRGPRSRPQSALPRLGCLRGLPVRGGRGQGRLGAAQCLRSGPLPHGRRGCGPCG